MGKVNQLLTAFNAGEWSPEMSARTDVEKYPHACHLLENFVPLVEGPCRRRPGTRFVQEVKVSANRGWPKKFEVSSAKAFILEFGDLYVRFYLNHAALTLSGLTAWSNLTNYTVGDLVVQGGVNYYCILAHINQTPPNATYWYAMSGAIYEIPSIYTVAAMTNSEGVCTLNIQQSGDVLYIANGTQAPQTLTRFNDSRWIFAPYAPTNGPFLEFNSTSTALWASGQSGSVTITASAALFAATDVGRLVRLETQSLSVAPWETGKVIVANTLIGFGVNIYKAMNGATTGTLPPTHISGSAYDGVGGVQWLYQHSGYGIARISAFSSATSVTATVVAAQPGGVPLLPADVVGTLATITNATQANPVVVTAVNTFSNQDNIFIFGVVGMTNLNGNFYVASAVGGAAFTLTGVNGVAYGAYTSGGTAVRNATTSWQLGAWSATTEYPAYVSFFRDRLVWLGKLRYWMSVTNDFGNMAQDDFGVVTAANAISEIIQSEDVNTIAWAAPAERLLVGTTGGEFSVGEITNTQPLGPANIKLERQSRIRCRSVHPITVGIATLYVQRAGRKLMSMVYNFYIDKYQSTDRTSLARHVQKPYLVDMAYQAQPNSVVWVARSDGQLVAMTIDDDQQVVSWHRHPIGGNGFVESISVIPAPDGSREEVWLQVRRTINGVTRRFIEYIEKDWDSTTDLVTDMCYLDAMSSFSGYINGTLTWPVAANTVNSSVTFTATTYSFVAGDVGRTIKVPYLNAAGTAQTATAVITAQAGATCTALVVTPFPLTWSVPVSLAARTLTAQANEWALSATTITGLGYLEGQSVQVLRDGAESTTATVVGGAITLEKPTIKAQIGLQCTARLVSMRLEGGSQTGSSQGRLKRVHECTVRFMDTVGGKLGPLGGKLDTIPFRTTGMQMDTPIPAFTGDKRVPFPGDHGRDDNQQTPNSRVEYRQDLPFASTIVGVVVTFNEQDF